MHQSLRLQTVQQLWRSVGAIVGHHDNVGKSQHTIPSDPFDDKGPFISHGRNNRNTHVLGVFLSVVISSTFDIAVRAWNRSQAPGRGGLRVDQARGTFRAQMRRPFEGKSDQAGKIKEA